MSIELTDNGSWVRISLNTMPLKIAGCLLPWLPVFAQALDDAVLLTTTNRVLEDQYCSVPIWKQKLNPWEQRKQFYKPSCCSGPLETPPGAPACWSVGGNEGTHPAKFISGQATFSSVLITTAIHRLQTKWRSFITWHAPCCWLSISVAGAEQAEQKRAGGRAISLLSLAPQMSPTGHCREELTSPAPLKQPHCGPEHGTTLGLSSSMWAGSAHGCPVHTVYVRFLRQQA